MSTPDELKEEQFNRVYRKLLLSTSLAKKTLAIDQAKERRRAELTENFRRLEELIEAADQATRKSGVEIGNSLELKVNEILQSEIPDQPELLYGNYEPAEISRNFRVQGVIRELTGEISDSKYYVKIVKEKKEIFRSSEKPGVWDEVFAFDAASNESLSFEIFELGLIQDKMIGNFNTLPCACSRKRFPITDRGLVLDMRLLDYRVLTFFVSRVFLPEPGDYVLTMEIFKTESDGRIYTQVRKDLEMIAVEIDRSTARCAADVWRGFEFRVLAEEISRFAAIVWKKTAFGGTTLTREIMNEEISSNKITPEAEMSISDESEIWRGGETLLKFPGRPRVRVQAEISSNFRSETLVAYDRFTGRLRLPGISDHPILAETMVDALDENTVEVALMNGKNFLRNFRVTALPVQVDLGDAEFSIKKFPMYRLIFRGSREISGKYGDRKFNLAAGDWMSVVIVGDKNPDLEISGRKFPDVKHFLSSHNEAPYASRYFRSHDNLALDVTWARCVETGPTRSYPEVSVPPAPFRVSGEVYGLQDKTAVISLVTCPTHPEISSDEVLIGTRVKQGDAFDLDVRTFRESQTWLKIEESETSGWSFPTFGSPEHASAAVPLEVLQRKLVIPLASKFEVTFRNVRLVPWEEAVVFEPEISAHKFFSSLEMEVRVYYSEGDEAPDFVTKAWLPLKKDFPLSLGLCPPDFRLRCTLSSLDGNVRAVAGPVRIRLGSTSSEFSCGPGCFAVSKIEPAPMAAPELQAASNVLTSAGRAPEVKARPKFVALEDLMLPSLPSVAPDSKLLRVFVVSAEFSRPVNLPCQVCAYFLVLPAVVMAEAKTSFAVQEQGGRLFVLGEFLDLAIPRGECSLYLTLTTEKNEILGYAGFPLSDAARINGRIELQVKNGLDAKVHLTLRSELDFR